MEFYQKWRMEGQTIKATEMKMLPQDTRLFHKITIETKLSIIIETKLSDTIKNRQDYKTLKRVSQL